MRRQDLKFLLQLAKLPKGGLKDLLTYLNDEAINAIGITLFNIMFKSAGMKLSAYKRAKLRKLGKKNKKIVQELASSNIDINHRRDMM